MPRDAFGNWVNYPGNPVTTGTTIASAWWNGTYPDLGSAIGASLDRTGVTGGMTGQFKGADGTSVAPGIAFGGEPNTGLYRPTPGEFDVVVGGVRFSRWTGANGFQSSPDNGVTWANPVYQNGAATLTGAGGGLGLTVGSTATNIDVEKVNGYVDFSGATNPAATTGFANRLTPKNVCKAWVFFGTNGSGGVTIDDAFNVASITLSVFGPVVNFATAMGNTNYTAVGVVASGQPKALMVYSKATGGVSLRVMDFAAPGTPLNPNTNSYAIDLVVYGAQ